MTRTENEVDQIVFRWDSENLTGNTGFGPVAWSGPRDEAENLFQVSGPVLRASGDETRPALIRLHKRAGVVLIRRLPFKEADGGTSVLCHALVGSPALLDPAVCLGLHAWTWEGAAAVDLAGVRGRLPVVPEEVLVPATGRGQGELDDTLPYAQEELVGAVAELLRRPDDRFTVLDERGDTACAVLWGLHSMFGALIDRRWTFATHDTVELPAIRFAFVGRWSGAASRNTDRRRVDPRERCGDRAEEIADRLVRHHLRGVAEAAGGEYAVGSALHAAAAARRAPLLETAARAVDALDGASRRPAPRQAQARRQTAPRPPRHPDPWYEDAPGDGRHGTPDVRRDDPDPWYEEPPGDGRHGTPDAPWGAPDPWYEEPPADGRHGSPDVRRDDPDPWYEDAPADRPHGAPGPRRGGDREPRYGVDPGDRYGDPSGSRRQDGPPHGERSEASGAAYPSPPGPWSGGSGSAPAPGPDPVARTGGAPERPGPATGDRWDHDRPGAPDGPAPGRPPAPRSAPDPEPPSDPVPAPRADPAPTPRADPVPAPRNDPAPTRRNDPAPAPRADPAPVSVPPPPSVPPAAEPPAPRRSDGGPVVVGAHPRPVLPLVGPQWTGPAKGSRRLRARAREREAVTSLVHKLPTVRSVEEARELVGRGGSRELLDALRRPQAYAVVTVLLREIARRLPSWEHALRRELCEVAIGRELWAVAPPGARDDPSEPAEEQRAANAAELHRWAVRPLLGGGDAPVGTVAELLSRLRTSPVPSAREAFWLIVDGERPGLPDAVWLTLLKEAYGMSRAAHRTGPPGPAPSGPEDDLGNGYTRRFLRRAGLLIGVLLVAILLIGVVQWAT
ncbi:hypothetical protein ACIQ62_15010 [Streptomyces sp. NPDC096319]|uniref:hypothetical protein n=1 Tax=Streptomyces sp. NPDC096319 TaxID=3366084 RepID=UPI0038018703